MDIKEELKQKIGEQEKENIRLFNIFQYRLHDEEMQPFINEWREGAKKLRGLDDELYILEMEEHEERLANAEKVKETKTFINGYGEATTRYITSSTYNRAMKRSKKAIVSFLRNR